MATHQRMLPADYIAIGGFALMLALAIVAFVLLVDDAWATECPNPGEPCKVIVLTPQEEQMLMNKNGVLDTAQAARFIDLGNIVSYFREKIAHAPAGDMKPAPKAEDKPADQKP